ncbi:MAG: hypothetical protein KDA81_18525 [Planctomycetaceae bacterium]|nr:hypothetical protein [Planctomycetaceae bacterium]
MSRRYLLLLVSVPAILAASTLRGQVQNIPVTADEKPTVRGENTQVMMQAKLIHTEHVLEGLVTHDFAQIEKAAAALSQISLSPPPDLSTAGDKSEEQVYEHFRMEFARLAGQLERQARRQELEACAYLQQNLTATCIACHEYIRDYPQK